jgi:hypothetical protein
MCAHYYKGRSGIAYTLVTEKLVFPARDNKIKPFELSTFLKINFINLCEVIKYSKLNPLKTKYHKQC